MQRLVIQYTASDDCTYWAEVTIPIKFSNKDDLYYAILERMDKVEKQNAILRSPVTYLDWQQQAEIRAELTNLFDEHIGGVDLGDIFEREIPIDEIHIMTVDEWYGE